MEDSSPFAGVYRRCCGCGKLQRKGNYSKCSKCKVFVYCDITCQTKHWKAEHKATCKVQVTLPPPLPVHVQPKEGSDDDEADLDKPYKYIVINPATKDSKMTKQEWQNTVRGIDDITVLHALDTLTGSQSGSDLSFVLNGGSATSIPDHTITLLQTIYKWGTIGTSLVPGYSARYDGYNLRGMYDENYKTRLELLANRNGGLLYMQPEGVCHGSIVVWCSIESNNSDNSEDSSTDASLTEPSETVKKSQPDKIIPITRRNILQIIEYNLECGFANSVPERIHFENITKAAALKVFKKENFTMIDG